MRRTGKAAMNLGWRSLLALVGSAASVVGVSITAGCGGLEPPYGVQPLYGVTMTCAKDADCTTRIGADWYCDKTNCVERTADAGTSDAGK